MEQMSGDATAAKTLTSTIATMVIRKSEPPASRITV
jgi:hypothetical protein